MINKQTLSFDDDFPVLPKTRKGAKDTKHSGHSRAASRAASRDKRNKKQTQTESGHQSRPKHIARKMIRERAMDRLDEKFDIIHPPCHFGDLFDVWVIRGKACEVFPGSIPTCPGCVLDLEHMGDSGIRAAFEAKYTRFEEGWDILLILDQFKDFPEVQVCMWCSRMNVFPPARPAGYYSGLESWALSSWARSSWARSSWARSSWARSSWARSSSSSRWGSCEVDDIYWGLHSPPSPYQSLYPGSQSVPPYYPEAPYIPVDDVFSEDDDGDSGVSP